MNKYSLIVLFFLVAFKALNVQAQEIAKDSIPQTKNTGATFESGKEYILGGITVTGLQKFTEETVRIYSGLTNGQPIKLPGDKLTSAIKKLYESKQFSQVDVYLLKIDGNTVYLEFDLTELPQLSRIKITGLKKSKIKEIKDETDLKVGTQVTENLITTTKNYIEKKYTDKGYLKTKVYLNTEIDSSDINSVDMYIRVDKGERIKVKSINFDGNEALSDKKLRSAMKNTKQKLLGRFWKRSKYINEDYQADLERVLEKYSEFGYRDARILEDKLTWNDDNSINLDLKVEEGDQYRFKDILFIGNKEYSDKQLKNILRLNPGDIYNGKVLKERVTGDGTPESEDIQTLYQNNGFLFSSVNAVETKVENDSITVEIRIREDEQATIRRVTVVGNEKTNDHVIFRELRVKPGDLFSRENIIRSIREIGQLGFFDTNVTPDVKPDYQNKTADIEFSVAEKGGSQIELQGGYGGGAFIGTLGLSFNNFSIRNIFNKKAYNPIPSGDGQTLSIRAQASRTFNTYSISFSEPWLGGKKPQSFSFSLFMSQQFQFNNITFDIDRDRSLRVLGATLGLGERLTWPDDFFSMSQSVSFQQIRLNDFQYQIGASGNILSQGDLNNLAYTLNIARNSAGPSLIFPTYGSEFSIRTKATIPYSLFSKKDFSEDISELSETELADRFKWLEYYKIALKGKWYTELAKKFVLMSNFELGYLGTYNKDIGTTPVERFFVGGDGIAQGQIDGREIIGLRGYQNGSLSSLSGGTIYNKFQLEFRYSITDSPSASIYTVGFLEGGNSYDNFAGYNPFELKRSAGVGLRIFMPAFGLLGIDLGHGFDPLSTDNSINPEKSGWQTHFIIGRQF